VGIIGALASIMASLLIPPPPAPPEPAETDAPMAVAEELAAMRNELASIREALQRLESR
jgi:hypothetical protein